MSEVPMRTARSSSGLAVWALAGSLLCLCCCGAGASDVRPLLARGELRAAAVAAGEDRRSLTSVALAILEEGMSDEEQRRRAARGLSAAGGRARSTLRGLLEHPDVLVSTAAAEVLVELGSRRAEALLRARRGHEAAAVRAATIRGLARAGADSELFESGLADASTEVRAAAISALAGVERGPWAVDMLVRVVRADPEWRNRALALRSLARLAQGQRLVEAALSVLDDAASPTTLRLAAVSALGRAESPQRVEPLLLDRLRSGSPAEQLEAAVALARYGDAEGIAFLAEELRSDEPRLALARAAAVAAARIGGPLIAPLERALRHPDADVRLRAAEALLRLGEEDAARGELVRLVEAPGWTGLHAALVLSRSGDETSEAAIRIAEALDEPDVELRAYAAFFAGFLRNGLELGALAMRDERLRVRVAGAAAYLRALRRDDRARGRE